MDLTLSYFEPFTLNSTKQAVETVLLGQHVGAVYESREGGRFDLPPEAVWSRLPRDPDTNVGRDLPSAQIVGTAQIRVFHVNPFRDLQVLVTTVRTTIPAPGNTDQAARTEEPRWHDLVATPGRAVPYKIAKNAQNRWDTIAESAAVASSRGIDSEQAISLQTIGRRCTISIRKAAMAARLSDNQLQRREIQLSTFGRIFLAGQPISDTAPAPDELILVGAATSVDRAILDLLLNGLRRFEISLRDQPSDPIAYARLGKKLDYLGSALPVPRTSSNDSFQHTLDCRLSIATDSARCRDSLWRANQTFNRYLVSRLSEEVRHLSRDVEAVVVPSQAMAGALAAKSEPSGWSAAHSATMAITLLVLGIAAARGAIWVGLCIAACVWIMVVFAARFSGSLALRPRPRPVEHFESD